MKFFVTGGSGFIGSHFCKLAIAAGHDVTALVRPASAPRIPAGVHRVYGQLPYDVPGERLAQCDAVIHLAAVTTGQRAGESLSVNEFGTEYLVKLAQKNATPFIFTSTQSAHGGNHSAYATTKRHCEEMIKASGLPWAIVRPGLVYGPGNQGLYARMRSTVQKLPVMPLLGGGKALVQPIHVDDLSQALLTLATDIQLNEGVELNLGDPNGLTLKDFLSRVARADQKKSRQLSVPLGPVKLAVGIGEKLKLPLPISGDNIRGLETVQRMDTQPSLDRLGLKLRDLDEGLRQSTETPVAIIDDRIPVVMIGAGKIGIVHGLQLENNPAVRLMGIVEPNAKAAKLYRSMGFKAPFFASLEESLKQSNPPQCAIIATPADTHYPIAEQCLNAGLHILVEKPLSVSGEIAEQWCQLREKYPDKVLHSGYMAAQFPQLLTAYHFARMKKLGEIKRVHLVALQTHITSAKPVRWEMQKDRGGGGVMINFGCHVAAMLFRLLGWPDSAASGWQWPIYSSEVEDALVAGFSIRGIQCSLVTSWSVPGYARPMNLVELECERGTMRVENSCIYIIQDGEVTLMQTQLDYPVDFNMAPDYTGAGFALEHEAFFNMVTGAQSDHPQGGSWKYMPPVEMPEALRLENWIRELYETLKNEKPTFAQLDAAGLWQTELEKLLMAGMESR